MNEFPQLKMFQKIIFTSQNTRITEITDTITKLSFYVCNVMFSPILWFQLNARLLIRN